MRRRTEYPPLSQPADFDQLRPSLVEAAAMRRLRLRRLAAVREELSCAQRLIAERMRLQDGQAFIARLEAGGVDPRLSTIERYADALGCRFEWRLTDAEGNPLRGFETADLERAAVTLESLGVTPTQTGIDTKQESA